MKALRDYTVKKGTNERVRITLKTAEGVLRASLVPDQAERFAADILACRFELPTLIVNAPKRKRRRPPTFITFQSAPRKLGARPSLTEETLKRVEVNDPEIRVKLQRDQEQWDRKAKRRPRTEQEPGFFTTKSK